MSEKLKRLEIFIGLWKYLVFAGKKMPEEDYPIGGILESDAEVLEAMLEDDARDVQRDKITADEIRYTAYITDREYRDFLIAIDKDRIVIDDID
jgi:hypothetical protein